MKKHLPFLVLICLLLAFTVNAQKAYVPDDNFEQALSDLNQVVLASRLRTGPGLPIAGSPATPGRQSPPCPKSRVPAGKRASRRHRRWVSSPTTGARRDTATCGVPCPR